MSKPFDVSSLGLPVCFTEEEGRFLQAQAIDFKAGLSSPVELHCRRRIDSEEFETSDNDQIGLDEHMGTEHSSSPVPKKKLKRKAKKCPTAKGFLLLEVS